MEPGEFDLVGFAVGIVERSRRVAAAACAPATASIGLASPGLRCNGYSLARAALLDRGGRDLNGPAWVGAHHSLAEELLRPSVIYAPAMLKLAAEVDVHAFAHVTGGGIAGNLVRVLPDRCDAVVRRGAWDEPRVFEEIQLAGAISTDEMEQVFNLGLGMLVVVAATDALARSRCRARRGPRRVARRRARRRSWARHHHARISKIWPAGPCRWV